jgi:exportin-1
VNQEAQQAFYKNYYIFILEHIFEVSTNILHAKANLQQHAMLLMYLIKAVHHKLPANNNQPLVMVQLNAEVDPNNSSYVYKHIGNLLQQQFGESVTPIQIKVFVEGIFALYDSRGEFISHLRDFLIQMKEKRGEDTGDLFLEERLKEIQSKKEEVKKQEQAKLNTIPGMMNPYAALDDELIN